ncbi:acyl-CoA N-acyltransferase [Lentinula aciculospora]|uniref:Acyl-CoA N-acyltransferase n=1 Tax=Lentinula aciculospora TaxID=153920 RepID=A0A9W9DQY9_9AGAR|nr:acyl-CoA N-acyltransferase [Lentinula aciculospora]
MVIQQSSMMFETNRLLLRAVRKTDLESMQKLWNDRRVQQMLSPSYVLPKPQGPKAEEELLNKPDLLFAIVETKDGNEFVGFTNLFDLQTKNQDVRFGLALLPEFWGRGFATEIMRFVVDYAFLELALHRVTLNVFESNVAAIRVYEKIGFIREGVQRKANWMEGRWQDVIWMAILKDDWESSRQ